jgi:hypothetical protein
VIINRPKPGQAKTVSVKIDPVIKKENLFPATVITGNIAFCNE